MSPCKKAKCCGRGCCIPPSQRGRALREIFLETPGTLAESCCSVRLLSCTSMECSKARIPLGVPELCTCDFGGMMSLKITNAEDCWSTGDAKGNGRFCTILPGSVRRTSRKSPIEIRGAFGKGSLATHFQAGYWCIRQID